MTAASIGAVVIDVEGETNYLDAQAVERFADLPPLTRIPGSPAELLGVGLSGGDVVPVVRIGDAPGPLLICRVDGELFGLVGAAVLAVGAFPRGPADPRHPARESIVVQGKLVGRLDVEQMHRELVHSRAAPRSARSSH
jgi:hypothetical protein